MDVLAMLPSFPVGSPSPSTMQQSKICQNLQVPRMYHEHLSISNPSYLSKKRMMDPEKKNTGIDNQSIIYITPLSLSLSTFQYIFRNRINGSSVAKWGRSAFQSRRQRVRWHPQRRHSRWTPRHKRPTQNLEKDPRKKGRTPGEKNGTKPGNQPTNLRMVHSFRPWFNGNS